MIGAPMAACKNGIDPLHQKFSVKANVAVGVVINVLAMIAISRHRKFITPRILQDDSEVTGNPRQARHNKTLATIKAIPMFTAVYLVSTGLLYAFSRAERKIGLLTYCPTFIFHLNSILFCSWTNHNPNV